MDTILRSSKSKRISRYILRKEDLVEASSQAIYIDKTAFRGVLQTKDHPEVFYGENTCRILLWTEDFQRSSSDSRPSGDVLQHENFHSFSIDRTFARGLLQTPKRHSRRILLISERPSRDLLSSEDPPEDIFRQNSQRSSLDKSLLRSSVKRRSSRGLLLTAALLEAQPGDRPGIFLRQKRNLTEFFYRQKPFKGHLQRENLSEVFYRQQTLDKIQSRGQSMGLRRQKRGKKIFLEDLQGGKLGVLIFQAKKTSQAQKTSPKRLLEGLPGGERVFAVVSYGRKISQRYSAGRRPSTGLRSEENSCTRYSGRRRPSKGLEGREDQTRGSSKPKRPLKILKAQRTPRGLKGLPGVENFQKVFQLVKGSSQRSSIDKRSPRGNLQIENRLGVLLGLKIFQSFFCKQNTFQRSSRALLRIENLPEVF